MKATARRTSPTSFTHRVEMRQHELIADEPGEWGGDDEGPSPKELLAAAVASCTAITIEVYAKRKGWELDSVEVDCDFESEQRGGATTFSLVIRLPATLTEEQVRRLTIIAGKCPVHRVLVGEVSFTERVELV